MDMLATTATANPWEYPEPWQIFLFLLGIILALLGNAFFVAAEFAVARVRPSQLEESAKSRPRGTEAAKYVVAHLDSFLSACQFGITIFSLILGFLGEPLVDSLARPFLGQVFPKLKDVTIPGTGVNWISAISFTIAMLSFTALHVVIGELVPKSIAIRRSLGTSLALSQLLMTFAQICSLPIRIMNSTANHILIHFFRIQPVSEHSQAHTAEELAYLVAESERNQKVTETEREIMENALELNECWVRDVMTHRGDVIFLDADQSFEKNLEIAMHSKHTRFPLVRGHLENILGLIHIKDILKLIKDPAPDLMRIKREIKVVPETMPLDVLLKFFLKEKAHFALVADEFGHVGGIVFLDNVIEELVGDIQDEFDNEKPEFVRINENEFVVEGTTSLHDLAHYEEDLYIESGEVTTVGGYITQVLGRFPECGENLEILGYHARVTSVGERMVGQVHFTKTQPDAEAAEVTDSRSS
jgi:CBS domain containing-hemolysin-like protein